MVSKMLKKSVMKVAHDWIFRKLLEIKKLKIIFKPIFSGLECKEILPLLKDLFLVHHLKIWRVAVGLMLPLSLASEKSYEYILTLMDYKTSF